MSRSPATELVGRARASGAAGWSPRYHLPPANDDQQIMRMLVKMTQSASSPTRSPTTSLPRSRTCARAAPAGLSASRPTAGMATERAAANAGSGLLVPRP